MDETFLVRIDEEYPSDQKLAVKLVETRDMSSDYKRRLDALIDKLDRLLGQNTPQAPAMPVAQAPVVVQGSNPEVLREMKYILSDLNETLKSLNKKYSDVSEAVSKVESPKADLDKLRNSLEGLVNVLERKFYDVNDNLQELRERVGKRSDSELLDAVNELSLQVGRTGAPSEEVRGLISDLTIHVDNLVQRYDTLAQANVEENSERDRKLLAQLDDIEKAVKKSGKLDTDEIIDEIHDTHRLVAEHSALAFSEELLEGVSKKLEALKKAIETKGSEDYSELIEKAVKAESEAMQNTLSKELQETHDALTAQIGGYQDVVSKMNAIKKAVASTGTKVNKSQSDINKTIQDFNSYLIKLHSADYTLRLLQARNQIKINKKPPKWAKDRKKALEKSIEALESEVIDVMIVNVMTKEGMTISALAQATGKTNKKIEARVKAMVAAEQLEAKKSGKKVFYVLKK